MSRETNVDRPIRSLLVAGVALTFVVLTACGRTGRAASATITGDGGVTQTALSTWVPSGTASQSPSVTPDARFILRPQQAQDVAVVTGFLRAYNAGELDAALALLDERVGVSDCDYERVGVDAASGKAKVREWLRQRIADHDRLEVASIWNQNPGEELVVGVDYTNRSSDTLRRLGFATGITPRLASKVILLANPTRIGSFANGPMGGDPDLCRPRS